MTVDEADQLISARIERVAARYGITTRIFSEAHPEPSDFTAPRDLQWGPVGSCGISFSKRLLYSRSTDHEFVFHELVHLVMGRPSIRVCEAFALLPFEWQLMKWVCRGLPQEPRQLFRLAVDRYQLGTSITGDRGRGVVLGDMASAARRERWWKRSLRRAQQLGLLNQKGTPTFRPADWSRFNLRQVRRWSIQAEDKGRWESTPTEGSNE